MESRTGAARPVTFAPEERRNTRSLARGIAAATFIALLTWLLLSAWTKLPTSTPGAAAVSPAAKVCCATSVAPSVTTATSATSSATSAVCCATIAPTATQNTVPNPCDTKPYLCEKVANPGLITGVAGTGTNNDATGTTDQGTGTSNTGTGTSNPPSGTGSGGTSGSSGSGGAAVTSSGSGSDGSSPSGGGSVAEPSAASQPVIDGTPLPSVPLVPTPAKAQLAVGVSGSGLVAGKAGGEAVACGAAALKCFGMFDPGTQLTLRAAPAKGFEFSGWAGGCKGTDPSCQITLDKTSAVSAKFEPTESAAVVPLDVADASFDVRWNDGSGSGKLTVRGKAGQTADISVQLRRPGGSPVATGQFSVRSGAFAVLLKLEPGLISGDLAPGSYVVSVGGASEGHAIPRVLKVVALPAPAQGVIQHAFASRAPSGSPTATLHGTEAFAHFVFVSPPTLKEALTVAWFSPSGKLLGVARKSPGLSIVSSISSKSALPAGMWHAQLRLGSRVIATIELRVR